VALDLTHIPKIMRHHHWNNGAALRELWFGSPSTAAPTYGPPDTETIKMDWLLSFGRARLVFDGMISDKVWTNAAARQRVAAVLARRGLLRSSGTSYDDLDLPVPKLDATAVNSAR
jgi:hypothetical protein